MFPNTCCYGHFFLFRCVDLVPKICAHLSVTLCMNKYTQSQVGPFSLRQWLVLSMRTEEIKNWGLRLKLKILTVKNNVVTKYYKGPGLGRILWINKLS
jgi:hypothetical protein